MIVSLFAIYGPEHGKKGDKYVHILSFFFAILIWKVKFFMTKAATLPYKINIISEWFARYESEKISHLPLIFDGP